jgi:hypothetical protein
MGSGAWDTKKYRSSVSLRAVSGVKDFAYTEEAAVTKKIHPNLDPLRINRKPSGILESRDSAEHPESNAVFVSFDVTGSNYENAVIAQTKLPNLMELLHKYLSDPQVLIAANDDFNYVGRNCIQISDYESDIRIDEHIRNVWLTRQGGGNMGESYDLMFYAAARKTVTDCFEKRNHKAYFFAYADEPIFDHVNSEQVKAVFGDEIDKDIPIEDMIEELKKTYEPFILWPASSTYFDARKQYVKLFGQENVLTLQHPNLICEMIGSIVGLNEESVTHDTLEADLVSVGVGAQDLASIAASIKSYKRKITV